LAPRWYYFIRPLPSLHQRAWPLSFMPRSSGTSAVENIIYSRPVVAWAHVSWTCHFILPSLLSLSHYFWLLIIQNCHCLMCSDCP
jgi:hypothetical protein